MARAKRTQQKTTRPRGLESRLAKGMLMTGDVAELTGVSQQTVIRCCESGDLKHWRIPTGKRHRRIRVADAREWAVRHGLPAEMDLVRASVPVTGEKWLLEIGAVPGQSNRKGELLDPVRVVPAATAFEAGEAVARYGEPDALLGGPLAFEVLKTAAIRERLGHLRVYVPNCSPGWDDWPAGFVRIVMRSNGVHDNSRLVNRIHDDLLA